MKIERQGNGSFSLKLIPETESEKQAVPAIVAQVVQWMKGATYENYPGDCGAASFLKASDGSPYIFGQYEGWLSRSIQLGSALDRKLYDTIASEVASPAKRMSP